MPKSGFSMRCGDNTDPAPVVTAHPLTRLVGWAQGLVGEILHPGDIAVDLTAGTGRDTLFLFGRVGPAGRVLAFDIQAEAIRATADLLRGAGARVYFRPPDAAADMPAGVHLVAGGHEALDGCLPVSPRVILANLGYLPGGDPAIRTVARTTLLALAQGCRRLEVGGRIAVTVYVGQDSGREEGEAVAGFFAALAPREWNVLRLGIPNRPASPWLVVAEKVNREG